MASLTVLLTVAVTSVHADVLYGVSLNGHNQNAPGPSSLYVIDPITGAGTLIGTDLGHAVNSIAVDPTTGIMYGTTTSWSASFNGGFNGLLQIDTTTGTATQVGAFGVDPFGSPFFSVLGLSFNSSGNAFGWHDPFQDNAVTINKATGAATEIGASGIVTGGQVVAFDNLGRLLLFQDNQVFEIDTVTGAATLTDTTPFEVGHGGGAFDSNGLLWAPALFALNQDSVIRITDLTNDTFTDLDTDVEFLSAVTWARDAAPVPEPSTMALCAISAGIAGIGALRRRFRKKTAVLSA